MTDFGTRQFEGDGLLLTLRNARFWWLVVGDKKSKQLETITPKVREQLIFGWKYLALGTDNKHMQKKSCISNCSTGIRNERARLMHDSDWLYLKVSFGSSLCFFIVTSSSCVWRAHITCVFAVSFSNLNFLSVSGPGFSSGTPIVAESRCDFQRPK